MLRRVSTLLVAFALVIVFTPRAHAGDKKPLWEREWEHLLKKFDKDGDGQISKEEIEQVLAAEKAARQEKKKQDPPANPEPKTDPKPDAAKKDHPHRPHVHLVKDFDKLDTNKDGKISKDEFKAAWEAAAAEAKTEKSEKTDKGTTPAPNPAPSPAPAPAPAPQPAPK